MLKQEKSQEVTQQENNSKKNSQPSEEMEYLMSPYYGMIDEVRVLLVDHDTEFAFEIVDLLESYEYKVTIIDLASTATSVLSKDKGRFDIMIVNIHSPDLLSFQLLAQAVALDIVSIFVCDEHHTVLARRALDIGACLYLKKPLHEEFVKYMWQFVLRKRLKKENEREERTGEINIVDDSTIICNNIVGNEQVGVKIISNNNEDEHDERDNHTEVENNNINVVSKEKYKVRTSKRGRKRTTTTEVELDSQNTGGPRRKVCTEWTPELHAKFMEVVCQLGEGACYPKEILELMNVPGLTRMQVASHLQKCRNNKWRVPEARKARHSNGQGSSGGSQQRISQRKFGSMPRLQTNFLQQQHQQPNQDQSQRVPIPPEFVFPPLNNNTFARGEISTEQQVYRPQLVHVEPHYINIGNPVNNPLLSQINVGGLQQHTGGPYAMVGLGQGGPVIDESAVYAHCLGNHVQDYYNMNVNMGIGTYSDSAMISDTNENVTTDGFVAAAANANFQQFYGEHSLSDPSMNFVASHTSDSESESDERTNCDEYFNFNDVDYFFKNLGPPDNDLPNEQGDSEFDQVYSDDQVAPTPSVQFFGTTSSPDEEGGSEFDQVYSDNQVAPTPSVQFQGTTSFPDEQGGNEFNQVYFDDQVAPSPSVQFPGMKSFPNEST